MANVIENKQKLNLTDKNSPEPGALKDIKAPAIDLTVRFIPVCPTMENRCFIESLLTH
jgi:hypothetical protein